MSQLALSAVGRDRPGIVAAVTAALLRHGVNVEDSRMAILRGHFTMMLVLGVPEGTDRDALRSDLDAVAGELSLEALALSEVETADAGAAADPTHVLTVYGVDHPGIVHEATSALARHGVNITDLQTRLAEGDGPPLYALTVEMALPAGLNPATLEAALAAAGERERVEVSLRALDTHEL